MSKVNFFTAVSYVEHPNSWLETIDNYFYLGGEKAYVIPGHAERGMEGAVLCEDSTTCIRIGLKVLSYFTIVIPLIMLCIKAALRWNYSFHILDVKQKMEEGVDVSQDIINTIQRYLPKIQVREADEEITYHSHSDGNLSFSLRSVPNLIFKVIDDSNIDDTKDEYANMVKAQKICLIHQLNFLRLPHAKRFHVDGVTIIAKEYIPVQDESRQEQLYAELSGLNETARQLTTFIAKTGYTNADWRKIPIIDDAPEFEGSRRVAVLGGFGEWQDAQIGIFGLGSLPRGLISCLSSEEQIDIVLEEARRCGVMRDDAQQKKDERLEEMREYRRMQEYYRTNGIMENPSKLIQVDDLNTLGLDLNRQTRILVPTVEDPETSRYQTYTLAQKVGEVIDLINEAIAAKPEQMSIKEKRHVIFTYNHPICNHPRTWLRPIFAALVDKGYLFKEWEACSAYHIQA